MSSESSPYLVRFAGSSESFSAGQVIFSEGEPGDLAYVVKEGEVEIRIHGHAIETMGPGGILGEMALIDKAPRSATAVAKTDCKLASIDEARFKYMVQQTPFFAIEVMRVMARRLRKMDADV